MAKLNMSDATFYGLVGEMVRNQQRMKFGFTDEQQHALSIYATEKMRGADDRLFVYSHADAHAQLAGMVADYLPAARSASELAASVSEADAYSLRQIALNRSLTKLAEATGTEPERKPRADGMWNS